MLTYLVIEYKVMVEASKANSNPVIKIKCNISSKLGRSKHIIF